MSLENISFSKNTHPTQKVMGQKNQILSFFSKMEEGMKAPMDKFQTRKLKPTNKLF